MKASVKVIQLRQHPNRYCDVVKDLDDRALAHIADYFRALSEPLRLKILNELRRGSRNVTQLRELLACSQANVSKHLGVLARLGLVTRDARGTSVYYQIADSTVHELCDLVCGRMASHLKTQAEVMRAFRAAPAVNSRKISPRPR